MADTACPRGQWKHTYTLDGEGDVTFTGLPEEYPPALHALVRGMLACDPEERLGLEAVLAQLQALASSSGACDTCMELRAALAAAEAGKTEAESRAAAAEAGKAKASRCVSVHSPL